MRNPDPPDHEQAPSPHPIEYGRQLPWWQRSLTADERRRYLLWSVAVAFAVTLLWCFGMFWTCRPGLDQFCVLGFMPLILAAVWVSLGRQMLKLRRRIPEAHRKRWLALILLAFFLAPYSLLRAGRDMFTLSVRYHLWRAGGAEKVRAEFNQWVAARPFLSPATEQKLLFDDRVPGSGTLAPVPVNQLPVGVRYMHEHFPSRFGMSCKGVAKLDNVTVLTTTTIMIGPPGWSPEGEIGVLGHVMGSRRRIADGVWVGFGVYSK
jgi:hypothetical protein